MNVSLSCRRAVARGLFATLFAFGCSGGGESSRTSEPAHDVRVLLFTRTEGFRHLSIDNAVSFFTSLSADQHIHADWTEETTAFTDEGLAPYDVLVFANTTGDVLDDPEQGAVERFIRSGRGFVGVHSAADTEYDWDWYGELVGAHFASHPPIPIEIQLRNEDPSNPITAHMPEQFTWLDEIYAYDRDPRAHNQVLLSFADRSIWFDDANHPISWFKEFDGGRSFYTNLGHRKESWGDPMFQQHLLQGIRWAAGTIEWNRLVLTREAENPVAMAVAPDGRVLYVELTGSVRVWSPLTGRVTEAAHLDVDNRAENGLLGIALDPGFARNGYLYLYYSESSDTPPPADGPAGWNVLARFHLDATDHLDVNGQQEILRVPSDRACCHEAGGLTFGPDGSLFLSVGDNTDPFGQGGYAPLDERPGRERHNSQRTAQNPFDLRGKILRIRPDGSIPRGNLFPPSGERGRPEIFTMGSRNPFRIAVDSKTGRLYWGEVGPDAYFDSRFGPRGYDEINFADRPGNYGWPHCIGANFPYNHRDYATDTLGPTFSCDGMVPSLLAYDYLSHLPEELGLAFRSEPSQTGKQRISINGRTAIAGTVYRRPSGAAPFALPAALEGRLVMSDWTRDAVATLDVDEHGQLRAIDPLIPYHHFAHPIDFDTGADGALYVLEFGNGLTGANADAGVSRVEYSAKGELTPLAAIHASAGSGPAPLTVQFSAEGSRARGSRSRMVDQQWDFDGDGKADASGSEVGHVFETEGEYPVTLVVTTDGGRKSYPAVTRIVAGNTPPIVTILEPANLAVVPSNSTVRLKATVTDAEDRGFDCSKVVWDVRLGHNSHAHPQDTLHGCEADLAVGSRTDHDAGIGDIFLSVEARYTDQGGHSGAPSLTGRASIRLDFG